MKAKDLYWLAGWLEGEGCFAAYRYPVAATAKRAAREQNFFCVKASSTDKDIIDRVAKLMGARIHGPKRNRGPNQKEYWVVGPYSRDDVLRICRQMRPLMGTRRKEQIDTVIAFADDNPRRRRTVK